MRDVGEVKSFTLEMFKTVINEAFGKDAVNANDLESIFLKKAANDGGVDDSKYETTQEDFDNFVLKEILGLAIKKLNETGNSEKSYNSLDIREFLRNIFANSVESNKKLSVEIIKKLEEIQNAIKPPEDTTE